jgi:hypothetical protein
MKATRHEFGLSQADGTLTQKARREWPRSFRKDGLCGIYALFHGGELIRFGETGTGLHRVKRGFTVSLETNAEKKNYYAYHFRKRYKGKTLVVRYYPQSSAQLEYQARRRGVEAELAYQFRHRSKNGLWPKEMTEIHFCNGLKPREKALVNDIMADIKKVSVGSRRRREGVRR